MAYERWLPLSQLNLSEMLQRNNGLCPQVFDFELAEVDMRLMSSLNKNLRLFTYDDPA